MREAVLVLAQQRTDGMVNALRGDDTHRPLPLDDNDERALAATSVFVDMAASRERDSQLARAMFLHRAMELTTEVAERHRDHPLVAAKASQFESTRTALDIVRTHDDPLTKDQRHAVIAGMDDGGAPEVPLEVGRLVVGAVAEGLKNRTGGNHPRHAGLDSAIRDSRGVQSRDAALVLTDALDGIAKSGTYRAGHFLGGPLDKSTVEFTRNWISGDPRGLEQTEDQRGPSGDHRPKGSRRETGKDIEL